jgi:radical SAM protein (TIGR01212 family)
MENTNTLYYKYSDYLKNIYGEKVYKLPINLPTTCPNRDGTLSYEGCYFCSNKGTGFESLSNDMKVEKQLEKNMAYIGKRYKAKKFIAYFQNYTNTYMSADEFEDYILSACIENIVEIDIATRPDCLKNEHLQVLEKIAKLKKVKFTIELGLQSSNDKTLEKINRGHSVQDYINAVDRITPYGFKICTHFIMNLPWDSLEDIKNNAILINKSSVDQVKLHSLYIAKGSVFEKMYLNNEFQICEMDDYINRIIVFLENLKEQVAIQRLLARAPEEDTIFSNWNVSWWKIRDYIENEMRLRETYQGKCYKRD